MNSKQPQDPEPVEVDPQASARWTGPGAVRPLGIGLAMAVVSLMIPFLDFIIGYLGILVHELGHAVVAWLFGYPAIPAFDFTYGGGVTVHEDRKWLLVLVVFALLGWIAYRYRENRRTLGVLAGLVLLYCLACFTSLHEVLQLFAGHGGELLFGGIFLYRACSGEKIKIAVERPLYAFLGFYLVLAGIRFSYRLIASPEHRMLYEEAKGGGHWMDFSRIAEQYLGTELQTVAGFFLLCCLATPLLVLVAYRYREEMGRFVSSMLVR